MQTNIENEYLLRALKVFKQKIIVIAPDFKILAASGYAVETKKISIVGQLCHQALYNKRSPCEVCPLENVIQTGKTNLKNTQDILSLKKVSCFYSFPIFSGDKIDAIAVMDFEFPIPEGVEEKLQRANAFLWNLIHSAVDGVIAADKTGKIIIFNDVASNITGYSVDEALNNMNIRDIYYDNVAYEVMKELRCKKHYPQGILKSYHVDLIKKNRARIPISLDAAIVYEDEHEVATIGFFHDLREEIRLKKDLEKAQNQLMQSEKMVSLGKLAAGVAHQLNNPLGGIIIFSKLVMEEYELVEQAQEDMRRIILDAERCRDTVKELLEFSRQTSHLMRPNDINQAVARTLFLLENQTLFHNIEIEKQLAQSLPLIRANMQQLNHMFMNLILNAADAMEGKGKLTVKSYLLPEKTKICVEISDTGTGMSKTLQDHIFEPFYTTKEEGKGTGLGLSMVYGIVEDHSGKIYVKSKARQGATFFVEFPIAVHEDKGDYYGE